MLPLAPRLPVQVVLGHRPQFAPSRTTEAFVAGVEVALAKLPADAS